MANPPDRFDGFHHFNLCCRGKADTGRHSANLSSYVTDRRAFEFWNDGDWIAADRLMGVIRATMAKDPCLKGHAGPCQADHTGPLSLGFAHRPEFQLLCPPCNGAKNNRLSLRDVRSLIASEEKGESVISWHSHTAWAARKHVVHDDETALRMTKILRDNRRTTMATLSKIADRGHYVFLARLLHLAAADSEVEINQVENDSGTVRAIDISRHARVSKYAVEQKARRLRIAFESLLAYSSKKNRNAYVISTPDSEGEIEKALDLLDASSAATHKLNRSLKTALHAKSDLQLRELAPRLTDYDDPVFVRAFKHLQAAIDSVGGELASRWDDERYVRAEQDEDI
jgi:Alw26I/Eco31I/Esp3I family type II restriction endonuclease